MELTSVSFLTFLVILVLLYYTIFRKKQWVVLLVASITFLVMSCTKLYVLLYVLYGFVVTYFGAILIDKCQDEKKRKITRTIFVLLALVTLVGLKYTNFFGVTIEIFAKVTGINFIWTMVSFLAPIGISYYTIISIGYLLDVYRTAYKPQKNPLKYLTFMIFFPQMTSGPFNRYSEMKDELYNNHEFKTENITSGIQRIMWGFFKVLVISERMGTLCNTIYGDLNKYNGLYIVVAVLFYTIQLYSNFSGCIDIALGTTRILGIRMPENFRQPFFSKTMAEFWRRWHITLGTWFKDYIFYPMLKTDFVQNSIKKCKKLFGKKWGKKIPTYLAMLVLWITIGIWHDGAYHFILASGIIQWFYVVMGEIIAPAIEYINVKMKINTKGKTYGILQHIKVYLLFSFSLIFFRADSIAEGINIIKSGFTKFNPEIFTNGNLYSLGLSKASFWVGIISIIILFIVDFCEQKQEAEGKKTKTSMILCFVLFFAVLLFGCYGIGYNASDFIYGKF